MKKIVFLLSVVLLQSCMTTAPVNYTATSVAEEGGIKFVQFTSENEKIVPPYITTFNGRLNWYASPQISVSPDGNFVAYIANNNTNNNIYIKKTTGGTSTIQRTFRNYVKDLSFSPDGKYITFVDTQDNSDNIYNINTTEGSAIQQIAATSANENGPSYSPDGKLIYFTKTEKEFTASGMVNYRFFIWNFNTESSLFTQLDEGMAANISPDGKKMVVTKNNKQTNNGEIWITDLSSGQSSRIMDNPKLGYSSAQFSPDGKKLVFVTTTLQAKDLRQNLDIYTMNIDGTGVTQHTFHPGHDVSPRWAPDGKSIYFLSQRGNPKGMWNVWRMEIKSNF